MKKQRSNTAICAYCQSPFFGDSQYCCKSCELLSNWFMSGLSPVQTNFPIPKKWEGYNDVKVEKSFNLSTKLENKKFRFYIQGLQCSSCIHLLEDIPNYIKEIYISKVDYFKRTLEVDSSAQISLGNICDAIEQLGYEPIPLKEPNDYEKASLNEKRNDLKRIGVAGAVAGNTMLFSIPIYAGLVGPLGSVFKWISFFIFLPLIFYSATPFYRSAWSSLLARRVSVDMMIVVALIAGFLLSSFSLVFGSGDTYFDSTASFIFLILLTRYFLKSHQSHITQKDIFSELFENNIYLIEKENNINKTTYDQVMSGDILLIKKNQIVPCDAILKTERSEFDFSFLTGEAYPQIVYQNQKVAAGSRLLEYDSKMIALCKAHESDLAKSLSRIELDRGEKSTFQNISDLVSHRLTVAVFFIAGLFFILFYNQLGYEAFRRCLALITIACPCAVAFGTPLAHSLGIKKSIKNGFFIKSENIFEKLSSINKVIFDKTGTLTSSQLSLERTTPDPISEENKSIILGLENASLHPIALSLKKSWSAIKMKSMGQVKEIAGQGVEGHLGVHQYSVKKSRAQDSNTALKVDFEIDQEIHAQLYLTEDIKPEAYHVIRELQKNKFKVFLLTGDDFSRAALISKKLNIPNSLVLAEQSPESKKSVIQKENPCLFIGDGLNDLAALNEAFVSFAIKGSFESTFQVSDVYAPQKDLNSILQIFEISKKVNSVVKVNLIFAIFYNLVGGGLALLGFINPLVAAILMPLSSFLITLHTVWRLR